MTLHYQPKLDRDRYTWSQRKQDMDVWTRPDPVFGKDEPITIHLAGKKLEEEQLAAVRAENANWRDKIIVDNSRNYFHRCATETELCETGFKSSNQIDRLRGMLKDPPVKYSLRRQKQTPALNVVNNPSVDPLAPKADKENMAGDNRAKGFHPGPYEDFSWKLDRNKIPTRDYDHEFFRQLKGQDFK